MGYRLKLLPYKKRSWKVQFQTRAKGRKDFDIKESDYTRLGLRIDMTPEEVRQRIHTLNAQEAINRLEGVRQKIAARIHKEAIVEHALLPWSVEDEFRNIHLTTDKSIIMWRTTRKIIMQINLQPKHWHYQKNKIFKAMEGYSFSYIQKIIFLLNSWGKFNAYKHGTYFESIPGPRGYDKQKIVDSHKGQASASLTPELLESIKTQLDIKSYEWLYLTVWFGLRPQEVDGLKDPKKCRLEVDVLWIYQTKLTGIIAKDRWKPIPIKYEEQRRAIEMISRQEFKRPLNKTLKRILNGQYTCYAGRKGFTDLMLNKGNSLEAISSWLGHRTIERTWKNYKNKQIVLYE